MEKKDICRRLDELPFFNEFTGDEKRQLVEREGLVFEFRKREYIVREGEEDSSIFIVLQGEVAVTKNPEPDLELSRLEPGSIFGAISFLVKGPRTTHVIAKTEAVVLRFDSRLFEKLDKVIVSKFKDRLIKLLLNKLEEMNLSTMKIKAEFDEVKNTFKLIQNGIDGIVGELSSGKRMVEK